MLGKQLMCSGTVGHWRVSIPAGLAHQGTHDLLRGLVMVLQYLWISLVCAEKSSFLTWKKFKLMKGFNSISVPLIHHFEVNTTIQNSEAQLSESIRTDRGSFGSQDVVVQAWTVVGV